MDGLMETKNMHASMHTWNFAQLLYGKLHWRL